MARFDVKMLALCLCVVLASASVAQAQIPNLLSLPNLPDVLKALDPLTNSILCNPFQGQCQELVPKLICDKDVSCIFSALRGLGLCELLCSLLNCGDGKCLADGSCACNPKPDA